MIRERLEGAFARLPFAILLSLRSQWADRFVVSLLTAAAIAASVSLGMSVEVASRGLREELRRTTEALVGTSSLSISAGEVGVPESLVELIAAVPGVAAAAPLVRRTLRVAQGAGEGRSLHVLGLDLLGEGDVRRFEITHSGVIVRDPVRLLALPDSIVVAESFAAELGIGDGDTLAVQLDGRPIALTVRGLLGGELSGAFAGQIAVMDVYALQQLVGMPGRFDRVDVAVDPDSSTEEVAPRLRAIVDPAYEIGRDEDRESFGLALLRTYERFLWTIVLVAVASAALLAYAVSSMSIDRRLVELSLLRAAGMEGRRVGRAVLADTLVLAGLGTALGLLATPFVTRAAAGVIGVGSTVHTGIDLSNSTLSLGTIALGLGIGLGSVLAAAVPAAGRSMRISPLELVDSGRGAVRGALTRPRFLALAFAGAGLMLLASLETPLPPEGRVPLVVVGALAFASGIGHGVVRRSTTPAGPLARWIPRVGFLVGPSLNDRVVETALAVAAWSAISACVLSGVSTIRGYADSIDGYYYGLYGDDAVLLLAGDPFGARGMQPISPATVSALRETGAVSEIAAPRGIQLPFRGKEITVASFPTAVLARRGDIGHVSADPDAVHAALAAGELMMNESFGRRFGVEVGDSVSLPTRDGARSLRVGAAIRGMAGPNGSLHLDEPTFDELFPSNAAEHWVAALWLEPGNAASLDALRRTEVDQPLFLLEGREARRFVSRSTEKYRAMLAVPLAIGCVLGSVSLASLLLGATRSRQQEFALLRAAGATRTNVIPVVALSGCLVGLFGALLGLALGAVWTGVFCRFLSESIGWSIRPVFDVVVPLQIVAGAVAVALAASLVPGILSTRRLAVTTTPTP